MNHKHLALLIALSGQGLLSLSPAQAACTTEQYIAHGRAGLTDAQIAEKCKTAFPTWLAGQWTVTLKMTHYQVQDGSQKQEPSFNPFVQGMKTMTDIVEKPDEQRNELWLMAVKNESLGINRVYNPKYNPGSAPFAHLSNQQQSGHQLTTSKITNNHLLAEIVSPPYGNEGIETWAFDIDLAGNMGQKNQLLGQYKVSRKNLLDGKIYHHNGTLILTKVMATPR